MAVVINAKGTSVAQFQIGKQGPIIKNNSGVIEFKDSTDTDLQVQILSTANAVNNLTLTGSTTGNDATIAVVGTDTNINIKLEPKGTGEVILGPTGGSISSLQAEDEQDLVVKGGDGAGSAAAGDILIEGGDGSGAFASGNVEIRGGTGGSGAGTVIIDSTEFALPSGGGVTVGSATGGNQGSGTGEADLTITVTGAATGDEVALGLPAAPTSGIVFNAFVSSANTITVRAHNYTAGAIDPASATYSVRVFQ